MSELLINFSSLAYTLRYFWRELLHARSGG